MLKNKTYDILKAIALNLPHIATLYFALSGIWGLPYGDAVTGTIAAICSCLSAILQYSSRKYNQAELSEENGEDAEG